MSAQATVRHEQLEEGAVWRVVLATPKANILDMEKTGQPLARENTNAQPPDDMRTSESIAARPASVSVSGASRWLAGAHPVLFLQ